MIVSVDIQAAIAQRAGVGRYVKCLVERLPSYADGDELRAFCFDFKRNGIPFELHDAEARCNHWVPGRIVQRAWRTLDWPPYNWFAGKADVYHFTNFIRPPLTYGRSVISIYDVSFLRFSEAAEPGNLAYLTRHIPDTVRRADAIITISEFSRREIIELLGVPEDRVHAVYPGMDHAIHRPAPEAIEAARRELGLDRPYILFVSTVEPRKNIPFLVDVFDQLDGFDGDLVVAGMRGWKVEPILAHMARAKRAAQIRYMDYVEDRLLPGLYAGARAFAFPSLYEGFGFPPLEAMACGTPVVASTGGSLPEVLGEAAHILAPDDLDGWVEALNGLLTDESVREEYVARGLKQVGSYTWDRVASRTWEIYREVAS